MGNVKRDAFSLKLSASGTSATSPRFLLWIFTGILFVVCFVCFDQTFDMMISTLHSSDFLDCLFAGKLGIFYSMTYEKAQAGLYLQHDAATDGAIYNPIMYLALGICISPVYLLGKIFSFSDSSVYPWALNMCGRLVMAGFTIWTAFLLRKLASRFIPDADKASYIPYYFLSSPLVLYCVVISNQYDILCVILLILALFLYFDKKYWRFTLIIAAASCFKLFSLLAFLPLILLVEKRIVRLFCHILLSVSLVVSSTLIFDAVDPGYRMTQNVMMPRFEFYRSIFDAQIPAGVAPFGIFVTAFILLCAVAYFWHPKEKDSAVAAVYFPLIAYVLFFVFVPMHPQWFILILPFVTLAVFSMKNVKAGILMEIGFSGSFMIVGSLMFVVFFIMNNSILVRSGLGPVLGDDMNPWINFFSAHGLSEVYSMSLFAAFLFAFLLVLLLDFRADRETENRFSHPFAPSAGLLAFRAALILLFILPPLAEYWGFPILR